MNWRRRRTGPQVELVQYSRSGRLTRRTVTLYPSASKPAVTDAVGFDAVDAELDRLMADLRRCRAQLARGDAA